MDVRAQLVMVFHLDKCIGCHTCSISCKNIWTDRRGAEYMWWNNVETRPGVGYPKKGEDQGRYRGGRGGARSAGGRGLPPDTRPQDRHEPGRPPRPLRSPAVPTLGGEGRQPRRE